MGLWRVSVSPHIKSDESVEKIMWTVVACLMPPLIMSVFVFGIQVLFITAVSVASCVAVEAVSQKALGRKVTIRDGSAVITGLLLAYIIPPGVSMQEVEVAPWTPLGLGLSDGVGNYSPRSVSYNFV